MAALTRRVRWALLFWLLVAFLVWNGFFDILVTRGEKQYLLSQARYELGVGRRVTMDEVMTRTVVDARRVATIWAAIVLAAGAGCVIGLSRSGRLADPEPPESADH